MCKQLKLYFKDVLGGAVFLTEANFPSTSGKIEFNLENSINGELWHFIEFSIESSDKVIGDPSVYEEFMDKEESKHQTFIDSLDWSLISENGKRIKILVPVFFRNKEVNFRIQ